MNPRIAALLTGTPARDHIDEGPPRPFTADGGDLVVAIDCTVPGARQWNLHATEVDEAMRDELHARVAALTRMLSG